MSDFGSNSKDVLSVINTKTKLEWLFVKYWKARNI